MVKVTVKWGKETYKDVELDTAGSVHEFKAILYSMTDVPVEKQKVLCKGSVWKVRKFIIFKADIWALISPEITNSGE